MAFHVKRHEINHTPQWYEEHCTSEDGSASLRALLESDMKQIGANIDPTMHTEERVADYEEAWNEALEEGEPFPPGMLEAIERESNRDMVAPGCYLHPPFTSLGQIMDEHDLDEDTVREYLKWRVRQRITEERRAKKEAEPLKVKPHKWFTTEADTNTDADIDRL
jgi:hypothetical protein